MAIRQIQSVFTLGELDPRLLGRTDFPGYFKGAQELRDVLCIPQGGARRRFGTTFIKNIVDTGNNDDPITDPEELNGVEYNFSGSKTYLVIARPHDRTGTPGVAFEIFLNDTLQTTVTTTDYTIAQIPDLAFVPSQSRIVILHEAVKPRQLVRTNDSSWAISTIPFGRYPTYDFSIIDGVNYRETGGSGTNFTPSATSGLGVDLDTDAGIFNSGHVGGMYTGGGGIMRITAVNSDGSTAVGDILDDFSSTSAIKGADSLLESVAWGDFTGGTPAGGNRGWPKYGVFFQNRLFLARTPILPDFIFASDAGDYFQFDDSEALDTNGFSYKVSDEVIGMSANKALSVFTTSTVESSSIFLESPITPGNVFITPQSSHGCSDISPVILDNQVIFVDKNEQQVNSLTYDINSGSFNVQNISIFSPQLVNIPTSIASYSPESNDGEILLVTNTDGTMGILQSLVLQDVQGWTLARTQGQFVRAFASGSSAHVLVKRDTTLVAGSPTQVSDNVFTANSDFESIQDITAFAASTGSNSEIFVSDGDYLVIGHQSPFYDIGISLDVAAGDSIEPVFEYMNGPSSWTTFSPTDGTAGLTTDGSISWDLSTDSPTWSPEEFPVVLADGTISPPLRKFWMRISRTATTLSITPVEDSIFINVKSAIALESIDFDVYTDSTITEASSVNAVVTGLDHLVGNRVYATINSIPEGPYFVDSSGEITVSEATASVAVGVNYIPEITPMPLVAEFQFTQSVYQPKHVKAIYIDYYKSLGILVNGYEIPTLSLNSLVLDRSPIASSGFYEVTPMRGWDPRGTNTISQSLPLPMTIIAVGYRLEAT